MKNFLKKCFERKHTKDSQTEVSPDFKGQFALKDGYLISTGWSYSVEGKIEITNGYLKIKCKSGAQILPMHMIWMMFQSEIILKKATDLHKRTPDYRVIKRNIYNNNGGNAKIIIYQESEKNENNKLIVGYTAEYETVTTEKNTYEGKLVELYRIWLYFNEPYEGTVIWGSQMDNLNEKYILEYDDWKSSKD